jgi:hypothetical protein
VIAVLDIFALSPDFKGAVIAVHDATTPVALVVCFAGLMMCLQRALQERSVASILPALIQISIVSLIIGNMPAIGNAIEQAVVDIEQAAGVGNVSAFTQYTQVIKTKYGVDISALNNLVPSNGPVGPAQDGSMLTSYGQANDPNGDPASLLGIGAFAPFLQPGSLISYQNPSTPASAALSADMAAKYNVAPGQAFTVATSTGQTLNLIYSDKTATWVSGRVDVYDPNNNLTANVNGLGSPVSNFTLGATMANTPGQNPLAAIGSWANSLLHPAEAAQAGIFGVVILILSYIALALEWLAALVQSVLYYSEIAVAGLFVGFLLVPGLQNIAKGFLLSFVAIALAPIAFMIVGLLTKFIISLGVNAANNSAVGAANVVGMSYFWLVVLAIVVGVGSLLGPWLLGKQVIRGASGMADLLVGSLAAGRSVFSTSAKVASSVVTGGGSAAASGAGRAATGGSRRFP